LIVAERYTGMDCRTFRSRHLGFVDGVLPDPQVVAMQRHLGECAKCARHDTALRRGLMILRSLPSIEPSPDFQDRVLARLAVEGRATTPSTGWSVLGVGSFIAVAASVAMIGVLTTSTRITRAPTPTIVMPPVVALQPALPVPAPMVSQGFVASISAGVPVWPAAVIAEQAPVHFASMEMGLGSR
jgi:anti-sigma factor RsiW